MALYCVPCFCRTGAMGMIESKCAHCGKMFIPSTQHALIDGKKIYCKPTCFLHRKDGIKKPCGSGRRQARLQDAPRAARSSKYTIVPKKRNTLTGTMQKHCVTVLNLANRTRALFGNTQIERCILCLRKSI